MLIQVAKSILLVVSALFPIVDPIGGSPVFLLLTRDYPPETRKVLARRIMVNSFVLLIASYAIGSHVLSFFGISLSGRAGRRRAGCDFLRAGRS